MTIWISEEALAQWKADGPKQRGAQFEYSDFAIQTSLTVKEVFHLTNRQTEGFIRSVFVVLNIGLPSPDHTTLSKRGKTLKVHLPKRKTGNLHVVIDSTGLKLYGEGDWKVRQHGYSKRRTW